VAEPEAVTQARSAQGYTGPVNVLNDENIVVIGDAFEERPDALQNQRRLAGHALQEIERIIQDRAERIPFPTL
jgi:hypothetical protein